MLPITFQERILGGLYGLVIGDAVGVPYEFCPPDKIPPFSDIDIVPPKYHVKSRKYVPDGTWSDDSAQALCVLDSLIHTGSLDINDMSKRLLEWYTKGYLAVDNIVFDVGKQTSEALENILNGMPLDKAGPSAETDNGNGSLMRSLPLALWYTGSDVELIEAARLQSRITHAHPRSELGCAFYCLWARYELQAIDNAWMKAAYVMLSTYADDTACVSEITKLIYNDGRKPTGTSYIVDSLLSAKHAVNTGSDYQSTVRHAISMGNDTDTTACIAGGIAGIRYGIKDIPVHWIDKLRSSDVVADYANKLLLKYMTPVPR